MGERVMRRVPRSRRSPVPLVSSLHSFLCLSLRSDPVGNRALRARMTEGVVSERDTGAAGNHGNPLRYRMLPVVSHRPLRYSAPFVPSLPLRVLRNGME